MKRFNVDRFFKVFHVTFNSIFEGIFGIYYIVVLKLKKISDILKREDD